MTTTSNPPGGEGGAPADPFGVESLTALANQLFRALPGGQATPPVGLPASTHGPLPSVQLLPTETDLRSTPALAAGASTAAANAGSPRASLPQALPWEGLSPAAAPVPLDIPFELESMDAHSAPPVAPHAVRSPTESTENAFYFLEALAAGAPSTESTAPHDIPFELEPRDVYSAPPVAHSVRSPAQSTTPAPRNGFYFLEAPAADTRPTPPSPPSGERLGEGARIPAATSRSDSFDAKTLRKDFPILDERVNGHPLIWLDNAATTQKPRAVIERVARFYTHENSNVHRAAHTLAARATDAYEAARETVRRFLNAGSAREIVWVRGTTEGMNLLANTWGRKFLVEGDEIILTHLEHHSNIVPWQLLCAATGAKLKIAPVDDSGQILLEAYERLFTPRTKLASIAHVSNALGTILPVAELIQVAHRFGAKAIVDGAQAVSHMPVDVQALDCDFYVFSGHKVFGPTGIGAIYGKQELWDLMPPWQGGGNMITDVTFERSVYQPAPMRFEAGTGNIADAVGLGAALDYVMAVGMHNIARYEHELLEHATRGLRTVPGLRIIGNAREKAGVISLVLDGIRSEDVGKALDAEGIAVRSGHHCAQPALRRFGLETTVRPSLALYNTHEDVDALVAALARIQSGRR